MLNPYFSKDGISQGSATERDLVEELIIESIQINGVEIFYIPRHYVAKDNILGEDRLSTFTNKYPIEMYFDNIESFNGQGAFIQKFGYMLEQAATFVVSKRRWEEEVGKTGTSILPNRPAEGDLLYFPLTKGLFEIKFVTHQDPFYNVGKQYVYKLQAELYQYSSERIQTGLPEVDIFETEKSHDITINSSAETPQSFGDNDKFETEGNTIIWDVNNPFGDA